MRTLLVGVQLVSSLNFTIKNCAVTGMGYMKQQDERVYFLCEV